MGCRVIAGDEILLAKTWLRAACAELAIQGARSGTRITKAGKYRDNAAQENHHAQGSFCSGRAINIQGPGS
jgi:hypothetical protein